jgi:alpha/beta superfamily hydrolase
VRKTTLATLIILGACGCNRQPPASVSGGPGRPPAAAQTLVEARKGFVTKPSPGKMDQDPVEKPPANLFQVVRYESPAGKLAAYLTPDAKDSKKRPAIIWITGGDCNSIGDVWKPAPAKNDQTAAAFRKAGLVMMFPSLRGGNDNPGKREFFFGEVDDVLAAAEFLAKQPHVDPSRIYLGGHSTGGTLVLLTAECSDRFRAAFSFGPVENIAGYGADFAPFNPLDHRNDKEFELRAPIRWLHCVHSPVFVFEGAREGNVDSLRAMSRASKNPDIHFVEAKRADHFSILAPVTKLVATKVLSDNGPTCNLAFTEDEVNSAFGR